MNKSYKILIIDDSPEDRAAFRHFLLKDNEFNYSFLEEELGEAGIETCFRENPDCVLLDYRLPDTDGSAVVKTLNPDSLNPSFPVILLIGAGDEKLAVGAIKSGAQNYLVKGNFSAEELALTVHKTVEIVELRCKNNESEEDWREREARYRSLFEPAAAGIVRANGTTGKFEEVNDLTERRRAEEALRELEEFNRTVLENSPDCVKILDAEGRLKFMNFNGLCLLEIDDFESLKHEFWWTMWENETQPVVKEAVAKALRGETGHFQAFCPTAKGTPKWWDVIVSPIPDANGKIWRLISVSRDVTAQKRRELNLAFLTDLQADFAPLAAEREIMELASRKIIEHLNLSHCLFVEIDEAQETANVIHGKRAADAADLTRVYELKDFHTAEERAALAAGKAVAVNDVRDGKRSAEAADGFASLGIGALINASYVSEGKWKFALNAQSDKPREWRADEIELLSELSSRIYICLERARAEESLRTRNRQLDLLAKTSRKLIAGEKSEIEILQTIFDEAAETLETEIFFNFMADKEPETLRLLTSGGLSQAQKDFFATIKFGEYLCGTVAQKRERRVVEKLQECEFPEADMLRQSGIKAYAGFPLVARDELIGTVAFATRRRERFREGELQLIQTVCDQVAITLERARAETNLGESEKIFRLASDAAAALVYDADLTGKRKTITHGLDRVTGYTNEEAELSAEWFHALIHPDDLPAHLENLEHQLKAGGIYRAAHRLRRKDGAWIYVEDTGQIIRDENGTAIQIVGALIDVTNRRHSEIALRESEERFRSLFDSIDEGFCIIEMIFDDANKPLDYRFVQANPAMERLTGLKDALGRTARELVPNLEEFWFETYGKVALTGKAIRFENKSEPMNRWFDVYASRLGNESSCRVAVVFNNITERKEIEVRREQMLYREQRAREAAEAANNAKDEFLAVLSHELRSPLNSMLGWATMLNNGTLNEDMQRQAHSVIERNVRLQNSLIEDLLDVSRIISGKMRLEPENISFVSVVQNAVASARPVADAKNIQLEITLDSAADEMNGDPHRLQQIIGNLLTNAIKFTPENGAVSVSLQRRGDTARLSVTDNGIGIGAKLLPHIFERFRQADGSTKRQHGGLGLGLTIVRHLTEMHGGRVFAESGGDGQGATFTVELPLVKTYTADSFPMSENTEQDWLAQAKLFENIHLLVVDDDEDALDLLCFVLEQKGAAVTCTNSADEALRELKNNKFDLLISDLGMAGKDGFDLIRLIRRSENTDITALPAIALTGYVSAEDREKVLRAGFQTHLSKPLDIDKLFAVILNLIKNRVG